MPRPQHAGRKVRCVACNHKFRIPTTSLPFPAPAPAPESGPVARIEPCSVIAGKFFSTAPTTETRARSADHAPAQGGETPRKRPGYVDANGIWNELTLKDFEGGSDARPSSDPLAVEPHTIPKVPSFVRAHTPIEYRDESRGISNKQAMSLGGAILIVLMILVRSAVVYERSQRRANERTQAAAVELADKQVIDARHLFDFKAGYYVPGANPDDPNQGRFYIDLECTGPIPHHGCRLFIKSAKTRGYVDVRNPSDFAGLMRFDFHVISTNTSDSGPFTAWMEDVVLSKHDRRHRISIRLSSSRSPRRRGFDRPRYGYIPSCVRHASRVYREFESFLRMGDPGRRSSSPRQPSTGADQQHGNHRGIVRREEAEACEQREQPERQHEQKRTGN